MKNQISASSLLFACLLFISSGIAAQKKYQGLLWEISGNGLKSPSYLYGTMHVSSKLAFNAPDSFYICLGNVQSVALESSPDTWMDEFRSMNLAGMYRYQGAKGFYQGAFAIRGAKRYDVYELLENKNNLMDQILYRFVPGAEDYEEETYLDMFIFQAGAKANKPIHSLETFEEVTDLSIKAMTPEKDDDDSKSYRNYYPEGNPYERYMLIQEAYRRGDLDLLDSLNREGNPTPHYHHYFIVERNKNMVRRLDSLMHIHTVFTGIGAAHLPGDEGAIELLRALGYKVRAVSPASSNKGHKLRQKMNEMYRPVPFTKQETADKCLQVYVPGQLYEMPSNNRGKLEYLSPEPINGGYFAITRLFTYGPLFNHEPDYYMAIFDSLIYMATPGDITRRETIEHNGYKGYEIASRTSKNSYAFYRVFFTPTEIIIFKGTGTGEYIKRPEPQTFFAKLQIYPLHSNWSDVSPQFGGASWKMKGLVAKQDYIQGVDQHIDPMYQSYDPVTKSYYLVMRYNEQDLNYIEEDSFDLAYLGKVFGRNQGYEINSTEQGVSNNSYYIQQTLKPDKKHPDLCESVSQRLFTRGGLYYLLLTTAKGSDQETFFNSFRFGAFATENVYEEYVDSSLYYRVQTVTTDEEEDMSSLYRSIYSNDGEKDYGPLGYSFKSHSHTLNQTGEHVLVEYKKFNNYYHVDSLELFWKFQKSPFDFVSSQVCIRESYGKKGDDPTLDFVLVDTGSGKGIMTHMRLHINTLYTLQTLIDTAAGPGEFATRFFESFEPLDTITGLSVFEEKTDVFFADILGEDSTKRKNAIRSIELMDFTENDAEKLIHLYDSFPYSETEEQEQKESIIMVMRTVDDTAVYRFLEEMYNENSFNSEVQFTVLRCLSQNQTQTSFNLIKKLVMNQTPFTENTYKMSFFTNLYDSLELTKPYFPQMISLLSYPEYKSPVLALLAKGYIEKVYNTSGFISEKQLIIREANVELKRTLSNQNKVEDSYNYYSYYSSYLNYNSEYTSSLLDYYILMTAFKQEKDPGVQTFFEGISKVEDFQFILEREIANYKLGLQVDTANINKAAADRGNTVRSFNRLEKEEMAEYFPKISDRQFAFSYIYSTGYDEEEDSVVFLDSIPVKVGARDGYIYCFKRKAQYKKNWMIDYVAFAAPDSEHKNYTIFEFQKGIFVQNSDDEAEAIELITESVLLRERQRVNIKMGYYNQYDYGDYGDY